MKHSKPGQGVCSCCKQEKPLEEFVKDKSQSGGYGYCKACAKIKYAKYKSENLEKIKAQARVNTAEWYKNNPDAPRANLLKRYGLTQQIFDELVEVRGGLCDICQLKPDTLLHIDHDHQTKLIRGLLCNRCNTGLGLFKDSPYNLSNAIKYLNRQESNIMADATLVAEGTAANGTPVKVYDEGGLKVARDEAGSRLTHSDTLEGLKGAGFKLEEVKKEPTPEKEPETDPPQGSEPDPKPEGDAKPAEGEEAPSGEPGEGSDTQHESDPAE